MAKTKTWKMSVYKLSVGNHGDPMTVINSPEYIPREGEWLLDIGPHVSQKVVKVEYDYTFGHVYVYVSTPD